MSLTGLGSYLPVVAIVGRPNVGKSASFNRILGRREAIVNDTPGVTRDLHIHVCNWKGRDYLLVDTGGYDIIPGDELMDSIRKQVEVAILEADLIIFIVDGQEGLNPYDQEISLMLHRKGKPVFLGVNKIDSKSQELNLPEFFKLGYSKIFPLSALHGDGFYELLDEVANSLPIRQLEESGDRGIKISMVGRPNVGKSSIINSIIGSDCLVTSEIPGTTRDSTDTYHELSHGVLCFIDTAGIRRKSSIKAVLEKVCVIMAMRSIRRAQVVALVLDSQEAPTDQDLKIGALIQDSGKATIIVINKWDKVKTGSVPSKEIIEQIRNRFRFLDYAPILTTSAKNKTGLNQFIETVFRVWEKANLSIDTPTLNKVLQSIVNKHHHPTVRNREIKFYYIVQKSKAPPTFILFTNFPQYVKKNYLKYLKNSLRQNFGFEGSPIRLILRKRNRGQVG